MGADLIDRAPSRSRGRQRLRRPGRRIAVEAEDAHDAVAGDARHVAAMRLDGAADGLDVAIDDEDDVERQRPPHTEACGIPPQRLASSTEKPGRTSNLRPCA